MPTKDQKIEQMHKSKMQRYDNRDLGQQIGACVNKAVDLAIAEFGGELKTLGKPNIKKQIELWVDILFEIGTEKKEELTTYKPQPQTTEDKLEVQADFNKEQKEAKNRGIVEDLHRETEEVNKSLELEANKEKEF